MRIGMWKVLFIVLALGFLLWGLGYSFPAIKTHRLAETYEVGKTYMKTKHLGTLNINFKRINGIAIAGLSGLSWNKDTDSLYAVSDRGYFFRFRVEVKDNALTDVQPIDVVKLLDKTGEPLISYKHFDAEGLHILNGNNGDAADDVFLVSFEQNSRIEAFAASGKWLYSVPLSGKLERHTGYVERNRGLESITLHPEFGILVAPELGMRQEASSRRVIYTVDPKQKGMRWQFFSLPYKDSAVSSLEVASDGSLIILERSWANPFSAISLALRRIKLSECETFMPCPVEELAVYESEKGWDLDNYEGLAHYKDNQFFMVSDDNGLPFQKTLLTLVELDLN